MFVCMNIVHIYTYFVLGVHLLNMEKHICMYIYFRLIQMYKTRH